MKVIASAPGKLVLLGEYAVLDGASAVVMAVNRRAVVTLGSAANDRCCVAAPGWYDRLAHFSRGAGGTLCWDPPAAGQAFALLATVVEELDGCLNQSVRRAWSATLDTRDFFGGDGNSSDKLGLGSSAALTVALGFALAAWTGSRPDASWLPRLLSAHRTFQGGRGSGLDVAAAVHGGVLEYRIAAAPKVQPLKLPERVKMRCVWTRHAAGTRGFIDRIERWRRTQPGAHARYMDDMGAVSAAGVAALRTGDDNSFLDAVNDYAECLAALGRQASMDIFSEPHREIARLAAASKVVYKPCGAGGGDVGVAFALDEDRLERLDRELRARAYSMLDLNTEPIGAQATIKETKNANAGI